MNENVTVCITPKGDKPVLHFSQFDNERTFTVTVLADDGESAAVLTGLDIEFRLRKTDSHVVTIAPESVADNVITFKSTEQMCACCGQNIASVVLMKDDMIISTLDILVDIQRDILSGGLTSESDIRNLTTQIEQIVPEVVGDNYYNKQEVDDLLAEHTFDPTNYYNKSDVDGLIADKADADDVYTKTETDNLLADKADIDDVMSKVTRHGLGGDTPSFSFDNNCVAPMDNIECAIEALQDLHGYSKPWSGGGGKNKLDYLSHLRATDSGLTISATSGGAIHYQGTAINNYCMLTYMFNLSIPSGTTITVSRDVSVGYQHYFDFTFTDNSIEYVRIMPNTTSTTYTLPKDLKSIDIVCLGLAVGTAYNETVKFQLEYGSQATSWEPYSNICPISGHSSCTITVADSTDTPVNTCTVSFGQTVYGGEVDVTGGKLTVNYAYVDLSTLTWTYNSGSQHWEALKTDMKSFPARSDDVMFEKYASDTTTTAGDDGKGFVYSTVIYIASTDSVNSPTGGCVYRLATPVEVTFTPSTTDTINGTNKVSSSTGNMKSLNYFRDVNSDLVDLIRACMI